MTELKLKAVRCPRCGKKHGEGLWGTIVWKCRGCGSSGKFVRESHEDISSYDIALINLLTQ